jgi:hypothetical protein
MSQQRERGGDGPPESKGADDGTDEPRREEPRLFPHQPWMVALVLFFAVAAIVAGLHDPVWWLIGSPFILALALYLGVSLFSRP